MKASGRIVGLLLTVFGLVIGIGITAWLMQGLNEDKIQATGAIFGFIIAALFVLPMIGGGIYFMLKGQSEAKDLARVAQQRRLLDIVTTRGEVSIADIVLEMKSTRDQVQNDLHDLVGRGLFSGYVDWTKGMLFSVEASKLQGGQTCPNCGGKLELAGKGLIKCPYCGAEIFLS